MDPTTQPTWLLKYKKYFEKSLSLKLCAVGVVRSRHMSLWTGDLLWKHNARSLLFFVYKSLKIFECSMCCFVTNSPLYT